MLRPVRVMLLTALLGAPAALALAAPLTRIAESGPGSLRLLPPPVSDAEDGAPARSACVEIDRDAAICARLLDDGEACSEFVLTRRGAVVHRADWQMFLCGLDQFRVLHGDLDLDGARELIVVRTVGVSNGLGVTTSAVAILDGRDWSRPALEFLAEDFSVRDAFQRLDARRDCGIHVAEWHGGSDPARGEGTYLSGQVFRYEAGALVPEISVPPRTRRYLWSFERERGRDDGRGAGAWLSSPLAETRAGFPWDVGEALRTQEGIITGATRETVTLRADDGREHVLRVDEAHRFGSHPDVIERMLDRSTGRAFPLGYVPADPRSAFVGRRATLVEHAKWKRSEPGSVLWLEPTSGDGMR